VDAYPVASRLVNALMAGVMAAVHRVPALRRKLFQANFHTTTTGAAMVTLIYHRKLDDEWTAAAEALRSELAGAEGAAGAPHVIGRSRGQRVALGGGEVEEALEVEGRGLLRYVQVEGAFSQPNAGVCRAMLGWAAAATAGSAGHDLLELYCGNGNFTAAVAPNFRRVVATEVSKPSVAAAKRNLEANGAGGNSFVARMSSEEFVAAWRAGGRAYHRLAGLDLAACDFGTLLVDPPRAGLDAETTKLMMGFERVLYVSCNPSTLARDLRALGDAFRVERFAMFDQFPYTHHIECGVYLRKTEAALAAESAAAAAEAAAAAGGEEEGARGAKRKAEEDAAAPAE
jgi:tRNA (uracil-5-)-methyltransferase